MKLVKGAGGSVGKDGVSGGLRGKRRGFTLIELVVAVAIAALAASAVLNIGIQSARAADRLKKRAELSAPLVIAALHGRVEFSNTEKPLESLLDGAYHIEHEGLKNYLESRSVLYEEEVADRLSILGEEVDGFMMPRFEIIKKQVSAGGVEARVFVLRRETN